MPAIQTIEEITYQLKNGSTAFLSLCDSISDESFFRQPADKWSIAQNVTHLITSAKMTRLAYRLPKLILRIYSGKPNRPSRSYDEVVAKYKLKLTQGGRASGRFIAKPVSSEIGKQNILHTFNTEIKTLNDTLNKNWNNLQLDQYLAPHPLLGKLTLRELCYFTIYHTEHHLHIIKERLND